MSQVHRVDLIGQTKEWQKMVERADRGKYAPKEERPDVVTNPKAWMKWQRRADLLHERAKDDCLRLLGVRRHKHADELWSIAGSLSRDVAGQMRMCLRLHVLMT